MDAPVQMTLLAMEKEKLVTVAEVSSEDNAGPAFQVMHSFTTEYLKVLTEWSDYCDQPGILINYSSAIFFFTSGQFSSL